ncbi:hypothetical protein [Natrinema longum]|uniref:Uncharacterized protein n=1 Tax=Natrinema longum TaxID=370324 RepID=A0A8A2U6G7_9EURY|nr:hypothetical protein [Natrinema longum]MBZ6494245.1 hypothetical protein [Natrinema longum]QSW84429.1 hypothetical protein J0X27_13345 [Natrinema longum]
MPNNTAFIGTSSPIGYDYEKEPELNHPNPLLEAPLGLFLLYDEIWFLHHQLCPKNMKDLDYVKFISDSDDVADYREKFDNISQEKIADNLGLESERSSVGFDHLLNDIAPFATYDNHGRSIQELGIMPNPDTRNFLFDYYVVSELDTDVDYISNTFVKSKISLDTMNTNSYRDLNKAESIIASRVPNYQTPDGPYFEAIDDFRKYRTRSQFREKMLEGDLTIEELEEEFTEIRNRMLIESTSRKNVYESIISMFVTQAPVFSNIFGAIAGAKNAAQSHSRNKNYGWANFLAKIENHNK